MKKRRNYASRARYEIQLLEDGEWQEYMTFEKLERSLSFMRCANPDATFRIHDIWEDKEVDISEYLFERNQRIAAEKREEEEESGDWQQEGF